MHSECEFGAYTANNVVKDEGTSGVKANLNDLLIGNADLLCIFGSHVDVSLCDDDAFCDLNFAARTDELAACRACNVTGFTDGSIDTDECNAACAFGTVYGEVIA